MIAFVGMALGAGLLIGVSRQINGRLALSTSALRTSWWNHVVGLVALTVAALFTGGLWPVDALAAPWWAWFGGPLGVVFVAAGSWLVARIGAVATALLIIAGQMIVGVALDAAMAAGAGGAMAGSGAIAARLAGAALIFAGMAVLIRRS